MRKLDDILAEAREELANWVGPRETVYGNPDTMRISFEDLAEWENSAAGIYTGN